MISYQSSKKNNKANTLTRKPNKQPTDNEDKQCKHSICVLLPPNQIDQEAELQPIEEDHDKVFDKARANSDTDSNASDKTSPLSEQVIEFNQNNELCSKIHLYFANPKGLEKLKVYLKGLRMETRLLMKRNWLWVANKGQLQLEVIKNIHDQPVVGHSSIERMLEIAWQHYYWPGMKEMIQWFIRNCHVCRQAKTARDTYHSLLQSLLVPKRAWIDIIIDFVVGLLKCKTYKQIYNAILMVINQLSKERYYISCYKKDQRTSAEAIADLFLQDIWFKYGLPISIMSDREPQFVSKMWDSLCKLLGIKAKLSTTFHLETDSQSKNANQEAKQHLQSYVNYFQVNWMRLLLMREFSANANVSAITKVLLFLATKGYNLRMSFDPVNLLTDLTKDQIANSMARLIANRIEKVWEFMREKISKLQAKQVVAANCHRKKPQCIR